MKILVLSDTHGQSDLFLLARIAQECDLVLHLGDGFNDGQRLSQIQETPIIQVTGNTDVPLVVIPEKMITLQGHQVLLTHGHHYNVKMGLLNLQYKAQEYGATLVLFGHTHERTLVNQDGIYMFNPGSARLSANPQPSAGLLTLTDGHIEADWMDLVVKP